MNMRRCVLGLILCAATWGGSTVHAESLDSQYTWRNLSIGGGGYMTGIKIHHGNPDLIYLRTDVGGCYRYDRTLGRLVQLVTGVPYESCNLYGINGIALDPVDEQVVYVAAGKYPDRRPADVFQSQDQGRTWKPMHLDKRWGANYHPFRTGNLLEVNPHTRELWAGTLGDGLWRYTRGRWNKVATIPDGSFGRSADGGNRAEGPIAICFDSLDSRYVYVAVRGFGLYRSVDGGENFAQVGSIPADFYDLSLSKGGSRLFAAVNEKGIYRLDNCRQDTVWRNVSFEDDNLRVRTVTCSPHHEDWVISANAQANSLSRIFLSRDGGDSWTRLEGKAENIVTWHPSSYPGSAISQFAFDPRNPLKVYFTDWYSFYKTENILASPVRWDNKMAYGHEEMVPVTLASSPSGNSQGVLLYVGGADLSALQITDLDRYSSLPNIRSLSRSNLMQEVSDIACYEKDPDVVAFCGGQGWAMSRGGLAITTDGGKTLRMAPGYLPQWGGGKVAISGADSLNLVVVTPDGVRYTVDGGETFQESALQQKEGYIRSGIFQYVNPLCSDKVNGRYYLYNRNTGAFLVSEDKGAHFVERSVLPVAKGERKLMITTPPGQANHLFAALGSQGLYFSSEAGASWTKVEFFTHASLIAIGKEAPGEDYPALYVWGKTRELAAYRFYRSVDGGKRWDLVNEQPQAGNETQVMCADRNTFGRFYVGTNGTGVFIAELK